MDPRPPREEIAAAIYKDGQTPYSWNMQSNTREARPGARMAFRASRKARRPFPAAGIFPNRLRILFSGLFCAAAAQAATPVPMASQPGLAYSETFGDVANWSADFSSGAGANRFAGWPAGGAGTIPTPAKLTIATTNWSSGSTAGKQKGTGQLVLLATGSSDNSAALAVDFFMDFSGVDAGTLSFTWEAINNPTGDRKSSLRVYWSTNGVAFTELAGAQVLNFQNGSPATGTVSAVALPAAFNNHAGARLRFYCHNGTGGTTGNRPKLGLDNMTVTATAGSGDYPTVTITNPSPAEFTVGYSTRTQSFSGLCNTNAVGQLVWTNALTGESGHLAAGTNWTLPDVYLGIGTNVVTVRATNRAGVASGSQAAICRDMREFIKVMTANLTDRTTNNQMRYIATSERIFKALQPDVVAIQEWLVTNASRRAYVDAVFGTNYDYAVESYSGSELPNGVVSRWPITASGEWNDTQVSGRDFAWATINLPGTQDLRVVSVHMKSGSTASDETTRTKEAAILTNEIRKANWPASDFIVIAGDFNTPNRSDDCLKALSNVVTDASQPADQSGDDDTNITRAYPYDYVLPSHLFNNCRVPLTLGGIVFPDGLVFDSRVWNPPPPPVQTNDSEGTDMQHLAVMKQFAILTCTDCDDDGIPDEWEATHGLNTSVNDAGGDLDEDGMPNRDEYAADTHPGNSNSLLRINRAAFAGNVWHVDWQGGSNAHQIIQCSSNLLTGWTDLLTNHPPTPLSNQLNRSDTSPTNKFFIRVKAHR